MGKRTWIYDRIQQNAAEDTEAELDRREKDLRDYAEQNGMEVVGVSNDTASANDQNRPGLRQMMDAAGHGEFDVLLVNDAERLARDMKSLMEMGNTLAGHGVDIHTPQNESRI